MHGISTTMESSILATAHMPEATLPPAHRCPRTICSRRELTRSMAGSSIRTTDSPTRRQRSLSSTSGRRSVFPRQPRPLASIVRLRRPAASAPGRRRQLLPRPRLTLATAPATVPLTINPDGTFTLSHTYTAGVGSPTRPIRLWSQCRTSTALAGPPTFVAVTASRQHTSGRQPSTRQPADFDVTFNKAIDPTSLSMLYGVGHDSNPGCDARPGHTSAAIEGVSRLGSNDRYDALRPD